MILHTTPSTYIISHPDSIKYRVHNDNCDPPDPEIPHKSYRLTPSLFQIHKPFINNTHKNLGPLALEIQTIYREQVLPYWESLNNDKINKITSVDVVDSDGNVKRDNSVAVHAAKQFFSEGDYTFEKFHGENPTDFGVISEYQGRSYLFPPHSRFYNCDLFSHQFGEEEHEKYDLIVMDPPWKNKFIKRRKGNCMGYDTHSTDAIEGLQLGSILCRKGILAIWSTNSKTESILNEMLGKWGLVHLTTFYWLKVTTDYKVTCPFTKSDGKQPFESLIIATKAETRTVLEKEKPCHPTKVIVSVPSSINSHKPQLTDVLEHYFQRKFNSKCELFARYLLPYYNSYGNQVLKLNNCILFEDLV